MLTLGSCLIIIIIMINKRIWHIPDCVLPLTRVRGDQVHVKTSKITNKRASERVSE